MFGSLNQRRAPVVVIPPVEIDLCTAPAFRQQIAAVPPTADLVVDLGAVTFCDCAGLSVLVARRHAMSIDDGSFVLRDPRAILLQILQATTVLDLFEIETTTGRGPGLDCGDQGSSSASPMRMPSGPRM